MTVEVLFSESELRMIDLYAKAQGLSRNAAIVLATEQHVRSNAARL